MNESTTTTLGSPFSSRWDNAWIAEVERVEGEHTREPQGFDNTGGRDAHPTKVGQGTSSTPGGLYAPDGDDDIPGGPLPHPLPG